MSLFEKYLKEEYRDFRLLIIHNKNESFKIVFKNSYPNAHLTNNELRHIINNLIKINNDLTLANKSEKCNFLICLLNNNKVKKFLIASKVNENDIVKSFGINKTTYKKINDIFNKIIN